MTAYEYKMDHQGPIPGRVFSLLLRPCPELILYPLSLLSEGYPWLFSHEIKLSELEADR
jgi:hypothetical protein